MSEPFLGEIKMFAGNFAPVGWMFCEGQLLPISENDALFTLIGTSYGGDGQVNFALPDLRGRVPLHQGASYPIGQQGGSENVTLSATTMPAHSHQLWAASQASGSSPDGAMLAPNPEASITNFGTDNALPYPQGQVTTAGTSQPHPNLQPYLCVNFIIALAGIYPPQS
jgi:microcystin-dependent protein